MSNRQPHLLVLGLGNTLCGDDGLGAEAVDLLLARYDVSDDVRVLDGGTLGLSLLPYLEEARDAILVDAVRLDTEPGTFVRLEGDEVPPVVAARLSPHQIGVADLLDAARWLDRYPSHLILLGLVPATLELRLGQSDAVQRRLSELVDRVADEILRLGYDCRPKKDDERGVGVDDVAAAGGLRRQ